MYKAGDLHIGAKIKKAKAATETCGERREVWLAAREEKCVLRRGDFCGAESDKKI